MEVEAHPHLAADGASGLPTGWCWTDLRTVLPLNYGKALPERSRSSCGSFPVIGSSGVVGSHEEALAPARCIIVGRKGSAGSVFISERPSWPIDTAYYTAGTPAVHLRYGYWYLTYRKLEQLDQSTAIPSLSRDIYDVQKIPVPPLAEQRRIAERIDALFAEIAEGEASLHEAKIGLEVLRRSLLKAAVTGELTREWRETNMPAETGRDLLKQIRAERSAGKLKSARRKRAMNARPLEVLDLPELPSNWAWSTIRDIADVIGGLTKNPAREKMSDRAPYLRVANVQAGSLDLSEMKKIGVTSDDRKRASLRRDDLLIVEGNGSIDQIGRCALWREEIQGCVHQNHIIKARFVRQPLSEWSLNWLLAPHGRQAIQAVAASTSGLHTLSISKIEALPVPVGPLSEIALILRVIKDSLDVIDETLESIGSEETNAARLRQAVLKFAFEGKLLPQNPNDEPASTLLDRITRDHPKPSTWRRGRKSKTGAKRKA
ncbi:restriction endonuclease subunit S [Mangrovicella endophytica]|uniref:restriction endonuclease subunit S n=1 Tax=Mangrovicella endophytica TaxID=2066697 RepID=UPI0018E4A897|nr:restriction endonuclease subunit S [Mangrovicella endophytica]